MIPLVTMSPGYSVPPVTRPKGCHVPRSMIGQPLPPRAIGLVLRPTCDIDKEGEERIDVREGVEASRSSNQSQKL